MQNILLALNVDVDVNCDDDATINYKIYSVTFLVEIATHLHLLASSFRKLNANIISTTPAICRFSITETEAESETENMASRREIETDRQAESEQER